MKVVLNDYVEHLGERGLTVDVKPGYARNYLLPKGLAYLETAGNRKRFDQEQASWHQMDLKRRSAAEAVQGQMQGVELHFERRAGEKNVLFGSVTTVDVVRELASKGFELERKRIHLEDVIKELGNFEAKIQVHHDISVTVPIHVTRPGEMPVPDAEEADVVAEEPAGETAPEAVEVP